MTASYAITVKVTKLQRPSDDLSGSGDAPVKPPSPFMLTQASGHRLETYLWPFIRLETKSSRIS